LESLATPQKKTVPQRVSDALTGYTNLTFSTKYGILETKIWRNIKKVRALLVFSTLLGFTLLVGCKQTNAPAIPEKSVTPLESPTNLSSWPNKTLTLGLAFHEPLTLEEARSKLSSFGKTFHAGLFVIGEGVGAFRSQSAVSIDTVLAEVLRVAKHLAYVKPRHDCEIAARLAEKYGLQSYTRAQALQRFTRDQRLQNLARSIIASENTRKYALGVIEGSKPTLYAVAIRAKPHRIAHQLGGRIEGVARFPANGGIAAFHPPKPDTVKNIVFRTRAGDLTNPYVLFNKTTQILEENCRIKLFR